MTTSIEARNDHLRLVCLFFVLLSLVISGLLAVGRSAFTEPPAFSFAMAWLHCTAVIFAWQTVIARNYPHEQSFALATIATFAVLSLPCVAGNSIVLGWIVVLILALICILGFIESLPALPRMSIWQGICLLCGAPILAIILFFWINTLDFAHLLQPEFVLLGELHTDTLYYTAISSMLTQHGAISTGLDGLVRTSYHFFSILWIGRTSQWLHISPIHGYYLVVQVTALPLLFFSLVTATAMQGDENDRAARFPGVVLLPLSVMFVTATWDVWKSFLIQESFMLSLLLFMIGLPLLMEQARKQFGRGVVLRFITIVFLGVLLCVTKVSVGAIWFTGLGYLMARYMTAMRYSPRQILWPAIALFAASIAFSLIVPSIISPDQVQMLKFSPFSFPFEFPTSFNVAAINTLAMALGVLVIRDRIVRTGRDVPTEMLGVLMAAAWIITMMIYLPGASASSFLGTGLWVAIVVLARWFLVNADPDDNLSHRYVLICILAFSLVVNVDIRQSYAKMRSRVAHLAELVGASEPPFIFANAEIAQQMSGTIGAHLIQTISSQFSYGEDDALIFVPPSNTAYWNLHKYCYNKGLVIPALTGIPLVNGLPPEYTKCPPQPHYGYIEYTAESTSTEMSPFDLCAKAQRLGYRRVGILSAPGAFQLLNCN